MTKNTANTVLTGADKIVRIWQNNPAFSMGDVTLAGFQAAMQEVQAAHADVMSRRTELTALINTRNAKIAALSELVTRARSGVRSTFGPDSSQYEQAGGTRKSERKKPRRKPKAQET